MSDAVVTVSDLQVRRGAREILSGVSFEVGRGEVVALMGASGSGKTTILRVIAGLERFESGTLDVGGVLLGQGPPTARTLRALRQKVGLVFQFHCLFEHMSALDNVALALVHVQRSSRQAAVERARGLLKTLGVDHRAAALPRELSGGEAQRVAIARALAIDPPVLLMDEPTASLDHARRMELAAFARSLAGRDRSVLLTTHDEQFAGAVASRVLHVREGRIADPAGISQEPPNSGRPG